MKICVYAIAKNESKFIERWYNSVKEADYVCVLDTGSSDNTFEKLKSLNIITKQKKYENFRFDKARNDSMELIPDDTDICVCIDLDEVFGDDHMVSHFILQNLTNASCNISDFFTATNANILDNGETVQQYAFAIVKVIMYDNGSTTSYFVVVDGIYEM